MNCKEARRWMSPYIDSELGKTKTFEISEHLRDCTACAARFAAESDVDDLVRTRLEMDVMPAATWSQIERDVSTPMWIQRLRRPRVLALAASIMIVVTCGSLWMVQPDEAVPWIAQRLATLAPLNKPFVEPGTAAPDMSRVTQEAFGVTVKFEPPASMKGVHELAIVDVSVRSLDDGTEFVELKLNCCGEPVLLVLTTESNDRWPAERNDGSSTGDVAIAARVEMNVGLRQVGDLVAVAASRHPVQHLLESLTITRA